MTTALVTGASRGIGFATAVQLAREGWSVFAGARTPGMLVSHVSDTIDDASLLDLRPLALDVTDDKSVAHAVQTVQRATDTLDVLINNAGMPGTWADPDEVTAEDLSQVFDTNVFGIVRVTHAFLPLLKRADNPRLVFVSSSIGSFHAQTQDDDYADITRLPYPASKAAVNMLAVQYAKGLPGFIVTAVNPGLTATTFSGGLGQAVDDGAAPILAAARETDATSGRFMGAEGEVEW